MRLKVRWTLIPKKKNCSTDTKCFRKENAGFFMIFFLVAEIWVIGHIKINYCNIRVMNLMARVFIKSCMSDMCSSERDREG